MSNNSRPKGLRPSRCPAGVARPESSKGVACSDHAHRITLGVPHCRLPVALLLLACLGCEGRPDEKRLLFYCGAGIRPPAEEIADAFSRRHAVTVECDYAGSEVLLSRIKLSGVGDVYMPGDVYYVDLAKQHGLVGKSRTVCHFVPVILVQKGNPKDIRSLADFGRPEISVGLGDAEACAIGRKVKRIFAKNGLSEEELADNIKFRALTVNELGDKIKLRALDAVIVWDAVAAYYADSADVVLIPREKNVISTVAAGVLKTSQQPDLAEKLVEFIVSEEGRAIFEKHHYSVTLPE